MDKKQATSELVRLGVLSSTYVHEPHGAFIQSGFASGDGGEGDVVVWREAIPRRREQHKRHGQRDTFGPPDPTRQLAPPDPTRQLGGAAMTEVFKRDNIEWRMMRVVFSQPYATESMLLETRQTVQEVHNLDMRVFPTLSWYST